MNQSKCRYHCKHLRKNNRSSFKSQRLHSIRKNEKNTEAESWLVIKTLVEEARRQQFTAIAPRSTAKPAALPWRLSFGVHRPTVGQTLLASTWNPRWQNHRSATLTTTIPSRGSSYKRLVLIGVLVNSWLLISMGRINGCTNQTILV